MSKVGVCAVALVRRSGKVHHKLGEAVDVADNNRDECLGGLDESTNFVW